MESPFGEDMKQLLGHPQSLLFCGMALMACTGNETKVNELTPDLAVSVDVLDFGEHKTGETLSQNLELINAGQAILTIDSIDVVSDADGVFAIQEVPSSLGLQEVYELSIDFTPVDLESYTAELIIQSNDDENPTYTVSLTGIGGLGPLPDIALSTEIVDFGAVATGEESIQFLTVKNDGDADLTISETEQTGSGAFALLTDLDGQTIPAGAETSVVVSYVPVQTVGDQGDFIVRSDDPDEPEVSVVLVGNGGGESTYPVAQLICPQSTLMGETVSVDGASSADPSSLELTYDWSALQIPVGSNASLALSEDETTVDLILDVAGTYQVGLIVENTLGQRSPQAECLWTVEPVADVYAELSWTDAQADFDLHMTTTVDGLFGFESDCCWCNSAPNWSSNTDANPVLLSDSEDGSEAERIEILSAEDGEYYFRVHYFSDNGAGESDATIRIYVEGQLVGQYTESMTHNQLWEVGFVRWPSRVLAEELSNPRDWNSSRSCQ